MAYTDIVQQRGLKAVYTTSLLAEWCCYADPDHVAQLQRQGFPKNNPKMQAIRLQNDRQGHARWTYWEAMQAMHVCDSKARADFQHPMAMHWGHYRAIDLHARDLDVEPYPVFVPGPPSSPATTSPSTASAARDSQALERNEGVWARSVSQDDSQPRTLQDPKSQDVDLTRKEGRCDESSSPDAELNVSSHRSEHSDVIVSPNEGTSFRTVLTAPPAPPGHLPTGSKVHQSATTQPTFAALPLASTRARKATQAHYKRSVRCQRCMDRKKGCYGGTPCEECFRKGIPAEGCRDAINQGKRRPSARDHNGAGAGSSNVKKQKVVVAGTD